jgi:hypothetical protein
MPNPHLQPQDPFVQAKMNQGPGFSLKPPPVDTEYLNEIMGNALPKPAEIRKPGESLGTKIWNYTNMGIWISAFFIFSTITFLLWCWFKQRERNNYWAEVNIEFVDLVEEEESGGEEGDSPSDSEDDERVGGGYAKDSPLRVMGIDSGGGTDVEANAKLLSLKSDKVVRSQAGGKGSTSGTESRTQGDEPVFYPRREYYRYNFE